MSTLGIHCLMGVLQVAIDNNALIVPNQFGGFRNLTPSALNAIQAAMANGKAVTLDPDDRSDDSLIGRRVFDKHP